MTNIGTKRRCYSWLQLFFSKVCTQQSNLKSNIWCWKLSSIKQILTQSNWSVLIYIQLVAWPITFPPCEICSTVFFKFISPSLHQCFSTIGILTLNMITDLSQGSLCLQPEGQPHPELHWEEHGQHIEGGESPPLLCSCDAQFGGTCPTLGPQQKKDVDLLRQVQKKSTELLTGLKNPSYEGKLREFSLEKRRVHPIPKGGLQ